MGAVWKFRKRSRQEGGRPLRTRHHKAEFPLADLGSMPSWSTQSLESQLKSYDS